MTELEQLPGFRFHPTEEELLEFYLKKMVFKKKFRYDVIGFLNIYRHDPWDLPGLAKNGEREWYFFVPRDRKQGNGGRPNRTTTNGFWKATGSDRQIRSLMEPKRVIGLRKTLVFYKGRAPKGCRTDWVMNEYRMPDNCKVPKEDIVLCKVYRKATSLKELEERAAMEEHTKTSSSSGSPSSSTTDAVSFPGQNNFVATPVSIPFDEQTDCFMVPVPTTNDIVFKTEMDDSINNEVKKENEEASLKQSQSLQVDFTLPDLQLPKYNMDWNQDSFWTQLRSPWLLDNWSPYANILNFDQ